MATDELIATFTIVNSAASLFTFLLRKILTHCICMTVKKNIS